MIKSNTNIELRVPKSSVWNVGHCLLPTTKINLTQLYEVTLPELIGEHQLSFYRQRINEECENMTSPSALLAMTKVIVDWFWLPTTTVSNIHILMFSILHSNNNSNKNLMHLCWSLLFQMIKVSQTDKTDRPLYIKPLSLYIYDDKPLLSLIYHGQLTPEAESPGELPWKSTSHMEEVTLQEEVSLV